ncbi:NAD(P)-dependent oxidoreductase [Streptomyces buecherae]|uniref:SDR family oxidoreductase n=1 Tax=Streptomyces buecherae TaxID=2763006 RepID=A0A7H8NBC3_9ACTN|nr:SDR family oxidoreductase [Streptomyces buecherae]QKW51765.1 SDR family oxidoreductase [Streptomyces buecherae]
MRLTVFGATGGTGRLLVRQALDAGHQVTAVVRDPARLAVTHPELTVVTAPDLTDERALRPAVAGRDAVLSAVGAPTNKRAGIASAAARGIVRAMAAGDVRRLVAISAAPVGEIPQGEALLGRAVMWPLVRAAFRKVYADLAVMERVVAASDTDWTLVRPPRLLDRPLTGTYRTALGTGVRDGHSLSRADLAHAMLALLDDPRAVRQYVGVAY